MAGPGKAGTRFPRSATFPRWRRIPSLPQRWEIAPPSVWPVCLAKALPSFFTSLSAAACHPPMDSATRGRKAIPCRLQSSSAPLAFLSWANERANPGSVAARASVASWKGWTTVTLKALKRAKTPRFFWVKIRFVSNLREGGGGAPRGGQIPNFHHFS